MSDTATENENEQAEESKGSEESKESKKDDGKRRRPWLRRILGLVALVVVVVAAVILLGGSDKKLPPGGSLKAGKQQLLPLSPSGKLAGSPGQKVVGKRMAVRSVVAKQGFWIGGSHVDRVYVKHAGPPANNAAEQVDLVGTVKPAPGNVAKTLKLPPEDAAKVTAEGAYIDATRITPAK
jgi:hypothetical protein